MFVVTGANAGATGACVPADCKTDADGKVTFTYTGTKAGDDTINAAITVDGSRQTATARRRGPLGGEPDAGLDPATATNPVGTPHTVTATVKDDKAAALAGVPCRSP